MIVDRDRIRKLLIYIFIALFLFIAIFSWLSSPILYLIDSFTTEILSSSHNIILSILFWMGANFSRPLISFILTLICAFLLWGNNFKIPAAWFLFTMIGSMLAEMILSLITPWPLPVSKPSSIDRSFPSLAVLMTFLLIQFFFVIVVPEFNKRAKKVKNRTIAIIILWLVLVCFAVVAYRYNTISDVFAALFFGYAWFLLSEEFYYNYARIFVRLKIFRGSWI
ncbi:phosphatase PAP2 family protein [Oenococcus sicerae]|uniref:Phosphatase PAP2 family protein n=1 Tax=Oenococcus sicerae TaxID=2203724 RepID=A0AAJ1VN37_9LACO|nr:phosphatase PAP2 family protein [Oenococcus sicerae]MDN6900336.1 phosphatase PAP2 family protein [Oenococcus sicerae]QAS69911.1 phosphatase PAP2 family protein [Oenococcus sicerae]